MHVKRRVLLALATAALAVTSVTAAPAGADPDSRGPRDFGNGPERNEIAATDPPAARRAGPTGENEAGTRTGYPRRTELRVYPEDRSDKSIKLGLTPYHAIAPRLNALQARSDRVSVEVVGQSGLGRDLYFVTLTAPERPSQTRQQAAWRALIEDDPVRAARDRRLARDYKAPVWINNNIHGNEWEGTDAALRQIEYLATTDDPAARRLLAHSRVYFNVTANPDGRVAGTRANTAGFDLNRDFVTNSQAENVAMRDTLIETQPVVTLDEHGYVSGTLIEPTGPPHGQNYDFDLYIKHGYANGLQMEQAVKALGHPEAQDVVVPFRDWAPGDWDGWPPIFTAQYAMYHGAVSYTVEIPLRVNNDAYTTLPEAELRRRSAVNTAVSEATMKSTLAYVDAHRAELVGNQIEIFRRGAAGEAQRYVPDGFVPGFGPEDRFTTEFPRAYVIPAEAGQRSGTAAARLVDHLVAHDVRVRQATRPFRLDGRSYPAGSYVVDMHQPKRGLANAMLEAGKDLSADAPQMYDIAGWSHRLLWGASVDIVRGALPRVPSSDVVAAAPTGGVDAAPGRDLALRLVDGKDASAVNDLLGRGLELRRAEDGTIVVPAAARQAVTEVANRYGVRFTQAAPGTGGAQLTRVTVAAAVSADELVSLREMGFDVRPVSTAILNAGYDLSGVDVLVVSAGLRYDQLQPAAKARVDALFARGGVVTRGTTGSRFNADAALLPVTAVPGRGDANGVVSVDNAGADVLAGSAPTSFAYSPQWFTGLGAGVRAEQRYGTGNPLIAGHWLPNEDGSGGPQAAAGQAAVVSGVSAATGARVLMFGTEPMFRAHPKGLFAQVAAAVFWGATR